VRQAPQGEAQLASAPGAGARSQRAAREIALSEAETVAARLGHPGVVSEPPASVLPPARPRRLIRSRHTDRDFALRRALLVADLLGLWMALALALTVTGNRAMPLTASLWILLTLPAWALLFRAYGLYRRPIRRFEPTHLDDVSALFHTLVVGTLGLWLAYKLAPVKQLGFEEVAVFALLALPLVALLRVALRVFNLRLQGPERVFAVAPPGDVLMLRHKLRRHPEYEMELVGAVGDAAEEPAGLPLTADLDGVEDLVASGQVDHVIVRLDAGYLPQDRAVELMRACHREGIRFGCFPGARGLLPPGIEVNNLEGMGVLTSHPPVLSRSSKLAKRALDLVLGGLALALLAPLLAVVALAVALDSKGGVLFRQVRVGRDGRRFELFKFRTMVPGADRMDDELMKRSVDPDWLVLDEDPRVTRLGRLLRRNSIDELPQLWNVLKGDMSLVGPRPLSERDDGAVRGWRRHRLDLPPGITGYWQVLGRNDIPFQEMLEVDYAYVTSWSLWHDLKLLVRTVPVVLRRRGAN
jgi:exopolysaccharide biosynthesis polyprenyl glycosylphosphotransferase